MTAPAAPYGPNTAAVRAFLRDLSQQRPEAWARAARVYGALSAAPEYGRAAAALGEAIENAGLERARDAVVGPLVQLAESAAGRLAPPTAAEELAEAALAAALALLARTLLPPATFDALYRPFAPVIPPPP